MRRTRGFAAGVLIIAAFIPHAWAQGANAPAASGIPIKARLNAVQNR